MNKRIKKLWVEALRSGKYKQGDGQLRNYENEFCCLGVLCNIHAQEHPRIAANQTDTTSYLDWVDFTPPQVVKWAGLPQGDPTVNYDNDNLTLSELNDVNQLTFLEIADVIERQL